MLCKSALLNWKYHMRVQDVQLQCVRLRTITVCSPADQVASFHPGCEPGAFLSHYCHGVHCQCHPPSLLPVSKWQMTWGTLGFFANMAQDGIVQIGCLIDQSAAAKILTSLETADKAT